MANETPVKFILEGIDEASPVIDEVNEKLIESEKRYISKLQEQLIMLERGKNAAEEFKLAEMGFSKATMEQVAAIRQKIAANEQAQAALKKIKDGEAEVAESAKQAGANVGKTAAAFDQLLGTSGQFGQLANIFEAMQKNAEESATAVQKLAGNLTIAAASATAMYAVSKGLVDSIMNQSKFQAEFNLHLSQTARMNEKNRQMLAEHLEEQRAIADLETDRFRQQEMYKQQYEEINQQFLQQQALVDQMQQTVDESGASVAKWWHDKLGFYQQDYQQAQAMLEQEQKNLELLKAQNEEARKKALGESEALKAAKEKARIEQDHLTNQKSAEEELKRLREEIRNIQDPEGAEARRQQQIMGMDGVTSAQQMELQNLRAIRDEERAMAEERQQRLADLTKTMEDNAQKQRDIRDAEKDYIEQLKLRHMELAQGKEAVEEHLARQKGVSEEIIKQGREIREQIKVEEERIKKEQEAKKKEEEAKKKAQADLVSGPAAQLQAFESRLMTSGNTSPAAEQAKKTDRLIQLQQAANAAAMTVIGLLGNIQKNTADQGEIIGD